MLTVVLLLGVVLLSSGPVSAAEPENIFRPGVDEGAVEMDLRQYLDARDAGQAVTDRTRVAMREPVAHYLQFPACEGNSPASGLDTMCPGVDAGCPMGNFNVYIFRAPVTVAVGEPGWEFVGEQCNTPDAPGAGDEPAALPVMTLEDFRRLPLPAGRSAVEPPGGNVLVGMPTNVFARTVEPIVLDTTLLTYAVQVRATPQRYSWDFGDGTVLGPTREAGAAYPALTNTHEYTGRGSFQITMTTYYSGEYSIAGGPWLPIEGEAQVDSASTTVQALAGRNELVAEPLP